MTSTSVFEISRQDVQKLEIPALASITNVKHLSSYNWIEADNSTPIIAVPGSPARWSPPAAPRRLNKDSGLIYIAQNAARHPQSPLEPLFRALYVTNPAFDIRSTDVVTDRNNIRKLLSFINPGSTRNGREPFTMNIETTKNTAIFCRDEAKITEYLGPHEFRGFGHEFEKAYTTAEVDGSTGHHRIISYRFGDLNFIVRHETDGYVDTHTRTSSSNVKTVTQDDLSNLLGTLSLSSAQTSPSITCAGSKLMIKEDGQPVPLESTLEIKTRVSHKPLDFEEVAPQLWASQTPKLVRAYHRNGTFQRPVVEDVTAVTKIWEERKQSDLRRLAALIRKIVNHVKECGGNAVLKYNVEGDKLVVSKAERKAMLPKDLYSKWDDEQRHPVNTDTRNDSVLATGTTEVGQQSIPAVRISQNYRYHSADVETYRCEVQRLIPKLQSELELWIIVFMSPRFHTWHPLFKCKKPPPQRQLSSFMTRSLSLMSL